MIEKRFLTLKNIHDIPICLFQIEIAKYEIEICEFKIKLINEKLDPHELDMDYEDYRIGYTLKSVKEYMNYFKHFHNKNLKKEKKRLIYYRSRLGKLENLIVELINIDIIDFKELIDLKIPLHVKGFEEYQDSLRCINFILDLYEIQFLSS